MSRDSANNHPLWVLGGLIVLYVAGYLALRMASQDWRPTVVLPMFTTTPFGSFVSRLYTPIFQVESRLRHLEFVEITATSESKIATGSESLMIRRIAP